MSIEVELRIHAIQSEIDGLKNVPAEDLIRHKEDVRALAYELGLVMGFAQSVIDATTQPINTESNIVQFRSN